MKTDKRLRADNICLDILYFKNYLIGLANVETIDNDLKDSVLNILREADNFYNQYKCCDIVMRNDVIKDLATMKEFISQLHIRKTKNKDLIRKYDEVCFYLSESKKLYFSDLAV